MITHKPNFHLFTGGPGVGKTALIRHLQALGEIVVDENARSVIRDEAAAGGRGVPWIDNRRFVALTAARDAADFDRLIGETRRVFFDRGIIDMVGANGEPPSLALMEAVRTRRYNTRVFVFPPWREIYGTDAERKQDWPEAEATFGLVVQTLRRLGYEPIVVPKADLPTRAAFVRDRTA